MSKNISKIKVKNVNNKFSQKSIDHAKHSTENAVKTASIRAIQKTAQVTGDLIGNKIADKISRVSKTSQKNNLETNEEETLRERYTFPKERQKIIDDLRWYNNNNNNNI